MRSLRSDGRRRGTILDATLLASVPICLRGRSALETKHVFLRTSEGARGKGAVNQRVETGSGINSLSCPSLFT